MNRRFLLALAGAGFFGLLSILAAKSYIQNKANQQRAQEETEVVIATADIPIGTEIAPDQIAVVKYPKRLLSQEAIIKREEVVSRVTVAEIAAKTPILTRYLASPGTLAGLSGVLKQGMRAVSVRVDEASGVSGFVAAGTYVDVIAIMPPQMEGARQVSKVILQNVRVLAGGQQMQTRNDGKATLVNTISLEVAPAQAEKLKLAEHEGKLQLSIRNTTDQIVEHTPGATRRDVLADESLERRATFGTRNNYGAANAAAAPVRPMPAMFPTIQIPANAPANGTAAKPVKVGPSVELIEGSKRTRVDILQ
ncbi:MAG: Flp pilus assembly protein CpaB [Acidobacteria bacterium]|nr:Flp pilus assembly protein CpaB [Acidobacteriota bacterium]